MNISIEQLAKFLTSDFRYGYFFVTKEILSLFSEEERALVHVDEDALGFPRIWYPISRWELEQARIAKETIELQLELKKRKERQIVAAQEQEEKQSKGLLGLIERMQAAQKAGDMETFAKCQIVLKQIREAMK